MENMEQNLTLRFYRYIQSETQKTLYIFEVIGRADNFRFSF